MKFFYPLNAVVRLSLIFLIVLNFTVSAQTPVAAHGQLSINGNTLVDENGDAYQLRGMSLFWSNWKGKYWNYDLIKWLRDDWHCNIVRAAMGVSTSDDSGYLEYPEAEKQKMITVIEAAIDLGIYVIVDWHSHSAESETTEAQNFFAEIAKKYGSCPNIIYEPYNEPLTDWTTIKTYHEDVLDSIRYYDPNNVVILGTPYYSQNIDEATNDPVSGDNLAYVLHYYAGTHTFWDAVGTVYDKGYCVFISEFGTCDASGDGGYSEDNTNTWWNVLEQYNVSWCNWSVSDKDETASIVIPGASSTGSWSESDLTTSGILVRNKLLSYEIDSVPDDIAPYITSNPQDASVPVNTEASFTVEVTGAVTMTYQWYFDGELLSGATDSVYTIASAEESNVGEYYCVITNSIGETTSDTAALEVRYRSLFAEDPYYIPGLIEAEDYDEGGQNIGYYDLSYGNSGGQYRNDDVDIEAVSSQTGVYAVSYTDYSEWLSYSVNVLWDDDYEFIVTYASEEGGGTFSLLLDDEIVVSETELSSTGDWDTYSTYSATVSLTEGEHIIQFNIETPGYNLDNIEFVSNNPPDIAPVITTQPQSTTVKITKDATISVTATGADPLSYQWYFDGVAISDETESSLTISGVTIDDEGEYYVVISNSLGEVTSDTVSLTVIEHAAYGGVPATIPGIVMCKNFDEGGEGDAYHDNTTENEGVTNSGSDNYYRDEGVDTEVCEDGETGYSVGYIEDDEWLEYSVNIAVAGDYTVGFRVASGSTSGGGSLTLSLDGTALVSDVTVANTGDWTTWATLEETVTLPAGIHILRLYADTGDWNINYMEFSTDLVIDTINIQAGWNLVALPLEISDASIETIFSEIDDSLIVKTSNSFYNSTIPSYLQSLTTLDTAEGYLVYNGSEDTDIVVGGTEVTSNTDFSELSAGWHLIGISGPDIDISTLESYVVEIKNFDGFYIPDDDLSTIDTLENGEAYFVKISW